MKSMRHNRLMLILLRILISAALCLGCQSQVVYLPDSEQVYRIHRGEPSPIDGYVLPPGTLLRLYRARVEQEER